MRQRGRDNLTTPPLTPPHKGKGNTPNVLRRRASNSLGPALALAACFEAAEDHQVPIADDIDVQGGEASGRKLVHDLGRTV